MKPVGFFLLGVGVFALVAVPLLGTPWPGVCLAGMGFAACATSILEARWSTSVLEARVVALEAALKDVDEKIKSVSSQVAARRHLGG